MQTLRPASYTLPTLLHGADYAFEQWLDEPDVLDDDLRRMRAAGMNAVSIGMFAWPRLEPSDGVYDFQAFDAVMDRMAESGIHVLFGTPSAAPPAWMSNAYPEVLRVDAAGRRVRHAGRQNTCRTSPVYRERCRAINARLAERYGSHPALLMWHVSNEYVSTPCHCALCYAAFRDWLRARHGDLENLNRSWWTDFWGHRYGDWDEIEPVDVANKGLMLDWQRFTSDQALDFFLAESAPLRELAPGVPLTTNFMQPDVGLDYWRFAPHVDIVSWDSYPRWHSGDDVETGARTAFYHDLHRSYRDAPFMLMESTPSATNWQGVSRPKRPGMHLLSSLQAVAHGSDSVQYFQWRQGRGGSEAFHGAVITHLDSPETRVFADVTEVGERLRALGAVRGAHAEAEVAVIYDFETEWALDLAELPQSEAKHYQARCRAHHAALLAHGGPVDVIHADAPFERYRLIAAPMLFLLRPGVAERLERFVERGGVLVTGYLSGILDANGLAFRGGLPPALRRVLGLQVLETDSLHPDQAQVVVRTADAAFLPEGAMTGRDYADVVSLDTAEALATYDQDFYRGSPAITRNGLGDGHAYYLATRFGPETLRALYAHLRAGPTPAGTPSVAQQPHGVYVTYRGRPEDRFAFVLNFADEARRAELHELRAAGFAPLPTDEGGGPDPAALPPYGVLVMRRSGAPPEAA